MSEKLNWKMSLIFMMFFALMIAPLKLTWNSQICAKPYDHVIQNVSRMFQTASCGGQKKVHFTKEFTITYITFLWPRNCSVLNHL